MDKRIEKTYDKIQHAYSRLIINKDYDDITVNDICNEANIKRPTFYNHFKDKDDFLTKIYTYRFNNFVEFYSLDKIKSFREFVLKLLRCNLTYLNKFKKEVGILNSEGHVSSMYYITFNVVNEFLLEKYQNTDDKKDKNLSIDEERFLVYSYSSMFLSYSMMFYTNPRITVDEMMVKIENAIPSSFIIK